MVKVFNRSLSFPSKMPCRSGQAAPKPPMSHHIRSISLPCRSHPLISQLRDEINGLNTWYGKPESRNTAWLCDGLSQLKQVHDFLDDVLQLPQTQESLRRQPQWVEKLLEDFIRLVDVYGIFQTSILSLKEDHSAAQVAIRRRDESKVALYLKSRTNIAKEMGKLASTVRCIGRDAAPGSASVQVGDAELASVINDTIEATKTVSTALLNGMLASWTGSQKSMWRGMRSLSKGKKMKVDEAIQEFERVDSESLWRLKKMGKEEVMTVSKRMKDLESGIVRLENGSERVFRGLINARVSLLNSLTQ